jgi:putative hydrolase of the HAD superfamily
MNLKYQGTMINAIILTLRCLYQFRQTSYCWRPKIGLTEWNDELNNLNIQFETGKITRDDFLQGIQKHIPKASTIEIMEAWNWFIGFSKHRLEFSKCFQKNTACFYWAIPMRFTSRGSSKNTGPLCDFYQCFEQVYFRLSRNAQTKLRNFQLCFK